MKIKIFKPGWMSVFMIFSLLMSFMITDAAFAGKSDKGDKDRARFNKSRQAVTARKTTARKGAAKGSVAGKRTGAKKKSSDSKVKKVTKSVLRTVSDLTKTVRKKKELMPSAVAVLEDGSDKELVLTEMDDDRDLEPVTTDLPEHDSFLEYGSKVETYAKSEDVELASKLTGEMTYATRILSLQPAILQLSGNTAVVGDIHGDYKSLERIISRLTPELESKEIKNVVFLGDYIDRGPSSARTLLTLLQFHRKYPNRVYLLRGNHETEAIYSNFGGHGAARDEAAIKLMGNDLMLRFFNLLPICAIINNETLCIHGGVPHRELWKYFWSFDKIFNSLATHSALWSDFCSSPSADGKLINSARGDDPYAILFNAKCLHEFLKFSNEELRKNFKMEDIHLKNMVRGHQPSESISSSCKDGSVTTVHSAVNGQNIPGLSIQIARLSEGSDIRIDTL